MREIDSGRFQSGILQKRQIDLCDDRLIFGEAFIGLFISDLQNDFVKPGIENFLNTIDGNGNTPIAAAIEVALDAIEIAGPIGEAIGVSLEAPLFDITEDVDRQIVAYLRPRFVLELSGQRQKLHWVGKEVDLRDAWLYFEIDAPEFRDAKISCTVLMDLLPRTSQ